MKGRKPVLLALTLLALCAGGCGGRGAGDAVEHGGGAGERSRVASERGRADAVRGRGSNGTGERGGRGGGFGCSGKPFSQKAGKRIDKERHADIDAVSKKPKFVDTLRYNALMDSLANGDTTGLWPVKSAPYPYKGAILPYYRVVAYYGNLYSKRMGVLGEYPPDTLWQKLNAEVAKWEKADPSTPVKPAIHYIVTTAQGEPGKDSLYRMRMPKSQIDSALSIARMGDALVFLDIQVGLSNVRQEVPVIEEYLKLPHVHLAIDPEFAMYGGKRPGTVIGTMNAEQINWCIKYLQKIVRKYHLPPKMLVIHRFTDNMVKDARLIKPLSEVQIIMDMDGWGSPQLKRNTYRRCIYREPVQFTGFKLFYKNDLKQVPNRMLTPEEILTLRPKPIYIQYQ
jgi:hypothetical protein